MTMHGRSQVDGNIHRASRIRTLHALRGVDEVHPSDSDVQARRERSAGKAPSMNHERALGVTSMDDTKAAPITSDRRR